jgi:hypothetical protein
MFLDMLSSIRREGVNASIYVSIATRCEAEQDNHEVQQAERGVIDRSKGIYPGRNTDLLGFAYRYDGCHFSDEGLEHAASLWLHYLNPSPLRASAE